MKNKQGLVLLTTLLFMQLITLLGLYAVKNSLLEFKIAQASWRHVIDLQVAETILNQIEKNTLTNCLHLICYGHFQQYAYQYQVERLATDSCGTHDRITLLIKTKMTKIALQSVVSRAVLNAPLRCRKNNGRQSWQQIGAIC